MEGVKGVRVGGGLRALRVSTAGRSGGRERERLCVCERERCVLAVKVSVVKALGVLVLLVGVGGY